MSGTGGFSKTRLARVGEAMRGHVERGAVAGVVTLLARRGEVHVNVAGAQDLRTGAPMRRDTIFRIASMTKPVTAVAALTLVEEARLRLDDPVDAWLPELAGRRVLRSLDAPLDDTVPARRPVTLRDLLTFRLGLGAVMASPGTYPVQRAMAEAGVAPGPEPMAFTADEYMARLGALPLLHQPGERWHYDTGSNVLGVLLERACGKPLGDVLAERVFEPLGMRDTGFHVPESKLDRLATCYRVDPATGGIAVWDEARGGRWSRPPAFRAGGSGLASTADDVLAFGRMLLAQGRCDGGRVLSRPAVELMTADHLTAAQKAASPFSRGFWDHHGWGFGLAVVTARGGVAESPGSYGWTGGYGTAWCNDPREDVVAVSLTQRLMGSPDDAALASDFFTLSWAAIDD